MKAADLQLNPGPCFRVAMYLEQIAPGVVFTSGRRSPDDQAHAMAVNIVQAGAGWLDATYRASPALDLCNEELRRASQPLNVAEVETLLAGVFACLSEVELRELTWHDAGDAFDVEPGSCDLALLQQLVAEEIAAGAHGELLEREGGLERWHVQLC